jgi:hypothetical protein
VRSFTFGETFLAQEMRNPLLEPGQFTSLAGGFFDLDVDVFESRALNESKM